ncbi:MAG: XdhC family protein [Gemmatimonadota bacterium]
MSSARILSPAGIPSSARILRRAAELADRGIPFALATVVRREAPSSARPGLKALVLADGTLHGWLGGACIEPTIREEALRALADGRPRLVVFAPHGGRGAANCCESERPGLSATASCCESAGPADSGGAAAAGEAVAAVDPELRARPGVVRYPMTCHSGGTVEIYVEPQLPSPTLELFGDSPVNRALARMAEVAGFDVRPIASAEAEGGPGAAEAGPPEAEAGPPEAESGPPEAEGGPPAAPAPELYAVVATMGEWDEAAIRRALAEGATYVGLVASPARSRELRRRLAAAGESPQTLARLVSPAGLDLGAGGPAEIAVSVLAQLVRLRNAAADGARAAAGARADTAAAGGGTEVEPDVEPGGPAGSPAC